ncbi:aldehyde dehydrogenase family protein [Mycolicibacterium sp.]|uniref:aldehyde dehydrogenase family protein n=1 Tax=Mycolicibacterium sp. TaxID=2320850 RepID=UPI0037C54F29
MPPATDWTALARTVRLPAHMWLDGHHSEAADGNRLPLVSPRDGTALTEVACAGNTDVERAVRGARFAFDAGSWPRMQPRERAAILLRWADLIEQHREEIALLIALEMGKPAQIANDVELGTSISLFRWYAELADKLFDESPRGRQTALSLITREPLGVVAAITPWNFPVTLTSFKIPAALVAGNCVVLKPASQSPLSMLRIAELSSEAGLPPGALQVITGPGGVIGTALARHQGVDLITFTGSPEVGADLLRSSAESNLKPVALELGGKSPNIIFDDVEDIDAAIATAAWAISFNSGQMCTAGSRLLIQRGVYDTVVDGVAQRLSELPHGDPLDIDTVMGPLATHRQRESVIAHIERGTHGSSTLVTGAPEPAPGPGWFLRPAVFADVDPDDALAQEEIFGPVLAIIPFEGDDDAVGIANNSRYALGASVWTSDLKRAHRMSRDIVAGTVWVNCYEEGDQAVPFGGRKLSGHGTDKGVHGLEKFTALKTTWINL